MVQVHLFRKWSKFQMQISVRPLNSARNGGCKYSITIHYFLPATPPLIANENDRTFVFEQNHGQPQTRDTLRSPRYIYIYILNVNGVRRLWGRHKTRVVYAPNKRATIILNTTRYAKHFNSVLWPMPTYYYPLWEDVRVMCVDHH